MSPCIPGESSRRDGAVPRSSAGCKQNQGQEKGPAKIQKSVRLKQPSGSASSMALPVNDSRVRCRDDGDTRVERIKREGYGRSADDIEHDSRKDREAYPREKVISQHGADIHGGDEGQIPRAQ